MTPNERLLRRLSRELPELGITPTATIESYRGPKAAGQVSWFILDLDRKTPTATISSYTTVTDLNKCKQLIAFRDGDVLSDIEIVGFAEVMTPDEIKKHNDIAGIKRRK